MRKTLLMRALLFAVSIAPLVCEQLALAEVSAQRVEVLAKRFEFLPADITVKKGEAVDLVLKSEDVAHGLRFRELNVEVNAGKGGTGKVHFVPNKTGTFIGHCSVFCGAGHGSMTLTLHVVD